MAEYGWEGDYRLSQVCKALSEKEIFNVNHRSYFKKTWFESRIRPYKKIEMCGMKV